MPKSHGFLRIAILTNDVSVDGVDLALSDRERELLTLLALCGGYAEADVLASLMWPNDDPPEAARSLWTCLMALRKSLPNPAIVSGDGNVYGLDAAISVDVWEIEQYLRASRSASRPRCSVDALLFRRLTRFQHTYRFGVACWAWSLSLRAQIDTYRRDVGLMLGRGLIAEGRIYEANATARQLLAAFPGAQAVRELAADAEQRLIQSYLLAAPKAG